MIPINLGQDITSRLKPESSIDNCFPVVDCEFCHRDNTPMGIVSMVGAEELITYYYCLNCSWAQTMRPKIKGWVDIITLEESEWSIEL